jgi:sporulation protein YlmC with PRC-barrel domain
MTQRPRTELGLAKLRQSDFVLASPEQDIRGKDVYDVNGEQIGSVDDLYIDGQERRVRFLEVSAGGFLRVGEKHFLVPVEAVKEVGEARIILVSGNEKVVDSPPFDTKVVPPATDNQRDAYDYYGYTDPYQAGTPRDRYSGGGAGRW